MKKEIKDLYKKDPKLARQVAKVLGYTIKVKAAKDDKVEKNQKIAEKGWKAEIKDSLKDIQSYVDKMKTPKTFDDMAAYLAKLRMTVDHLKKGTKKLKS